MLGARTVRGAREAKGLDCLCVLFAFGDDNGPPFGNRDLNLGMAIDRMLDSIEPTGLMVGPLVGLVPVPWRPVLAGRGANVFAFP